MATKSGKIKLVSRPKPSAPPYGLKKDKKDRYDRGGKLTRKKTS